MTRTLSLAGHVALGAVAVLGAGAARAETLGCTAITALPHVITTPGTYCLTSHLSTSMASGAAISIEANSVVLDLNGFKLGGQSAGAGTAAVGIRATGRRNVVVRNGTIRGFWAAVKLDDAAPFAAGVANVVEDIVADGNTGVGIQVDGSGCRVRRNLVVNTGGSYVIGTIWVYGISSSGGRNVIEDNDVVRLRNGPTGAGWGIVLLDGSGHSVVEGNRISDADLGVYARVPGVVLAGNRLVHLTSGMDLLHAPRSKYRENLTVAVATPFAGGIDAGGNQ